MEIILKALTTGDSLSEWFLFKVIAAILGGFCVFLIQRENAHRNGQLPIKFLWRGFWFTFVSAIGGICLLRPENAYGAFSAGLLGWYSVLSFMKDNNAGPSDASSADRALSDAEIFEKLKDEIDG